MTLDTVSNFINFYAENNKYCTNDWGNNVYYVHY